MALYRIAPNEGEPPSKYLARTRRDDVPQHALERYLELTEKFLLLKSRQSCLPSMASALRAWGSFADMIGEDHFPAQGHRMA